MDKILQLFKQAGVSDNLSEQIVGSIESYRKTIREHLETEFKGKIAEARKVCAEEVAAHKRDLARRLQIFCESQSSAIERRLLKNSAHKESESQATLKTLKQMLEGVDIGLSDKDSEARKKQLVSLKEEKHQATEAANRANAVAERALKRCRVLEKQLIEAKQTKTNAKAITEGTVAKPATKRIDESRSKPVATNTQRSSQMVHRTPQNAITEIANGIE